MGDGSEHFAVVWGFLRDVPATRAGGVINVPLLASLAELPEAEVWKTLRWAREP